MGKKPVEGNPKRRRRRTGDDSVAHVLGPTPSRAQVDGETQKYYAEISELLETVSDAQERTALCSSALEEARGKELQLACHPSCGRVLEKLLVSSDAARNVLFLEQCTTRFATMAMDPSGSHVAETLLKSLAEAMQLDEIAGLVSSIENVLKNVCEVLQERVTDMMKDRYGSHVLRRLVYFLAGLPFDTEKDGLTKRLRRSAVDSGKSKQRDFPTILKNFTKKVMTSSKNSIPELRIDTFCSLVFQTILKALHGAGHDTTEVIATLLELGDAMEGIDNLCSDSVKRILDMTENQHASHLVEVIVEVASDDLYSKLLQLIFLKHVNQLAAHHFSNFVVQALIACARQQEQVSSIFDELEKTFSDLIKNQRAGVVVSLLAACSRFNTRQHEICRTVAAAVVPHSTSRDSLVPRLLHLETYDNEKSSGSRMSTLGCTMLQSICAFPQDCSQQFYRSFSVLGSSEVLEAAKSQTGCHVLETFLTSRASSKQKHALIERLKGHFGELAMDTRSHYIVTKCYDASDIKLKEAIVKDLLPVQQDLSKTKHGPYILSKLNVAKYANVPDRWRSSENARQSTKEDFVRLFDSASVADNIVEKKKKKQAIKDFRGLGREKQKRPFPGKKNKPSDAGDEIEKLFSSMGSSLKKSKRKQQSKPGSNKKQKK